MRQFCCRKCGRVVTTDYAGYTKQSMKCPVCTNNMEVYICVFGKIFDEPYDVRLKGNK